MKIREVSVQNFRNFGPAPRTISFVESATQQVRPLTVLVGSNGSGKTSLLELLEGMVYFAVGKDEDERPRHELGDGGWAELVVAPEAPAEWDLPDPLRVRYGQSTELVEAGPEAHVSGPSRPYPTWTMQKRFEDWRHATERGMAPFEGGFLYFPHDRWIEHTSNALIQEPAKTKEWLFHFQSGRERYSELAALWVWQNYLDLEQASEGRPNLAPFVDAIETILGRGRRVVIRRGHVTIAQPGGPSFELNQLPSGEQQVLTLFGEIIRRLRPGAIVVIDEIEISLHPALQRAVLFHLRALALKYDLQIIMTTHSMEIVSAVAPEEVVDLDDMILGERAQAGGGGE